MKLKIIDTKHGPDSKAWYTLKPLREKYLDDNGIPTMWGLGVGNYERCLSLKNKKQKWLFCDMPYWNRWDPRCPHDDYYWRIINSDIHVTHVIPDLPQERIAHIQLKEWRDKGDYILVAPSSVTVNTFIGQRNWEQETINFLKQKTDMPIKVRHKPRKNGKSGPAYADVSLQEDLEHAACVVTSCSMVSVDAVIEGVPVYCHSRCCATPVAQTIENFGKPNFATNRTDWLATLSWHQYSKKEIQTGLFAEMFKEMYGLA